VEVTVAGDPTRLELIGGHPVVDFVNTLGGSQDRPYEHVDSYRDLARWAEHASVIDPTTAADLQRLAADRPTQAERALADVRALRARLDEVLRAGMTGAPADRETLDDIRDAGLEALRHARLEPSPEAYVWAWHSPTPDLAAVQWSLALLALDFLREVRLERLKACVECRWLFLDESRNRSRRWCSMNGCGARAKMRRYRAGRRSPGRQPAGGRRD
jgi:predicted RNA-binding Zn ribbon-like protein